MPGGLTYFEPTGITSNADEAYQISNLGLSASVGSNQLTVNITIKDGSTTPTATVPAKIGFRSATAASGLYVQRLVTAATSLVIPSSATIGHVSAKNEYLHFYAIDNAGTVELAVAGVRFDEGSRQSTTQISSGSTSKSVLYSTTARTNVGVRYIGRMVSNQATAGTWASTPTEISLFPESRGPNFNNEAYLTGGSGHGSTNTAIRRFTTVTTNVGTAITITQDASNGDSFTINEDGYYVISAMDSATAAQRTGLSVNSAALTTSIDSISSGTLLIQASIDTANTASAFSVAKRFLVGDVIRCHTNGSPDGTSGNRVAIRIVKIKD